MKAIHVIAVKKEAVLWEWDQLAAWIYFNLRENQGRFTIPTLSMLSSVLTGIDDAPPSVGNCGHCPTRSPASILPGFGRSEYSQILHLSSVCPFGDLPAPVIIVTGVS